MAFAVIFKCDAVCGFVSAYWTSDDWVTDNLDFIINDLSSPDGKVNTDEIEDVGYPCFFVAFLISVFLAPMLVLLGVCAEPFLAMRMSTHNLEETRFWNETADHSDGENVDVPELFVPLEVWI